MVTTWKKTEKSRLIYHHIVVISSDYYAFILVFYAAFLLAIIYHSLVTLFMDYSGGYEEKVKRFLPLVIAAITAVVVIITAPSGFFGKARQESESPVAKKGQAHFRQFCDLQVPTLMPSVYPDDELVQEALAFESTAAYR